MAKNNSVLQGVMEILKEVIKIPRTNKKIFLFIIISTMISYSLQILATIYAIISISNNLSTDVSPILSMNPTSPDYFKQVSKIKYDTILIFLVEMILLFCMTVVSLFSMMATIYVSAMSYLGRDLTVKDLVLKIKKIWVRPVITWFYISLLNSGYFLLILPLFVTVVFARGSVILFAVGVILIIVAIFVNIYLGLVWMLSLVTSVLEDCCGLKALGKAEKLVSGRKAVGIVLTVILMILSIGITIVSISVNMNQKIVARFLIAYVTLNLAILVKVLSMMVYTVFYFELKQNHGETVEVEEDKGYSRVSSIPLVDSALP